jgi:hypothetical protein
MAERVTSLAYHCASRHLYILVHWPLSHIPVLRGARLEPVRILPNHPAPANKKAPDGAFLFAWRWRQSAANPSQPDSLITGNIQENLPSYR